MIVVALVALAALMAAALPAAAIGAVVLTLPYFYHPLLIGSQRFAASELLLAAAVFGATGRLLVTAARNPRDVIVDVRRVCGSRIFLAAVALATVGVLLVAHPYDASHRADALREWRWTLLEPTALLVLLVLVAHGPRAAPRQTVAWCFLLGAAIASAHGLTDLLTGGGVEVEGVRRIGGPYPHPNALALYAVRGAAFGTAWFAFEQRVRWVSGPLTALCLLAVAATYSRGAYAAVGLAVLLIVWRAAPRLRWPAVAAGGLALVAALSVAGSRMLNLFNGGSGSLRIDIWRASLRLIRDRPITGYGPDQFLYAYSPRYVVPTAWTERFTSHPHDLFLDFWVRLGIIGAALAIVGVLWCIGQTIRAYRRAATVDALRIAAATALLAAITHGLVDNGYFLHDLAMSVWLLLWLAAPAPIREQLLEKGSRSVEGPVSWRRRFYRFASVRQPAG